MTELYNYEGEQLENGENAKCSDAPLPRATPSRPHDISWDLMSLNEWKLVTGAGFLTYPHHDAGGFATYVFMKTGMKIWVIFRMKSCSSPPPFDVEKYIQRCLDTTSAVLWLLDNLRDYVDIYVVMLTPGQLL